MNIQQLKCFCNVAFTGSFSESAEQLFMSQSSVSRNIQALEQELGIKLFVRNGKFFYLSDEGRKMLRYFTELLNTYDESMKVLERIKTSRSGSTNILRVAGDTHMSKFGVINSLMHFISETPGIELSIDECGDDNVKYSLQADDCDLAFCADIMLNERHFGWKPYRQEGYSAMISSKSHLALKNELHIDDLREYKIILNLPKINYDVFMETCVRQHGFKPNVVLSAQDTSTAMQFLFSNSDVVCITLSTVSRYFSGVMTCSMPLLDLPEFKYVLAWKKKPCLPDRVAKYLEFLDKHNAEEFIKENLQIRKEGQLFP